MWNTASHHGNPSFFKYGQHICRTKSANALLEGQVTVDQTQRNVGQGRTNCTCLDAITRRPHEHVNRLPNALTADCLLSPRGQANVRTRREEREATVLKGASAQKERKEERRGQTSDALRLNRLPFSKSLSICICAMIVWHLGISVHLPNTIHLCKHTTLHPSLSSSRVCPLVLLAWCLMEPVPHTGPLRDYAGANHRSCDSSISLQLALTRVGGACPCWKPAAKVADGAGAVRRMQPNSFCICVAAIAGFIEGFHSIKLLQSKQSNVENS